MDQTFPEDEYKTYKRESFSEQQLQTYLSQHFQRLDLLPYIEGRHVFKINNYLHSGNWFRQLGFPKESNKWYKKFFDYYNAHEQDLKTFERDSLVTMIIFSHSILAENYANMGFLDSAALEHKKNIKFAKELNIISTPSAYNNYGLFLYWNKNELDSALVYFNKAYSLTKRNFPNHIFLGSIRDNLADIYLELDQPEKARLLYKKNFDFYLKTKDEESNQLDIPRYISAGTQLVKTEIKLNLLNNAKQTFAELQKNLFETEFKNKISSKSRLEFLKAQEDLFIAQNNYEAAYKVSLNRNRIKDSLNAISKIADRKWQDELNTISLDRVALNFKIDRIEKENKINNQRSKLWIVSLTSSLVLILMLSLFLRRRQHIINAKNKQLLAEQELELTAVKNTQLKSEIESKQRDLSDFAINLTQNQEWAKELAEKIKDIHKASSNEQKSLLADLEQDIKNKTEVDIETKDFYERLDKLSDSFYKELTHQFPNLSKNEIRLCSLIRLKMDSRSIATLQNITLASLNTSRYRLRKKLNLQENIDLDDFIQNI
ncbi:tetratricopeptide repeat protein [Xanthomarina sp. F2636L]|uniref:tetratricopeptide repeat protein n=1 Tax=Xanthomarina sp. F2636L TaxID=2996018 RepID=UPI00225E322E|nr:tetratricopeptide repeat protein [Xanthomarina sp. F2636L]MCX7549579.1 tetratricopeptide repeat protein [Xanthomarina sp. F2636L]